MVLKSGRLLIYLHCACQTILCSSETVQWIRAACVRVCISRYPGNVMRVSESEDRCSMGRKPLAEKKSHLPRPTCNPVCATDKQNCEPHQLSTRDAVIQAMLPPWLTLLPSYSGLLLPLKVHPPNKPPLPYPYPRVLVQFLVLEHKGLEIP